MGHTVQMRPTFMNLKNPIALITGGGRAIGRAIGIRLAQDGADVALAPQRGA